MKTRLFIAVLFCILYTVVRAQEEYKASNGIIYHIGDSIVLGEGTGPDGCYTCVGFRQNILNASFDPKNPYLNNLNKGFKGHPVYIQKIKRVDTKYTKRVYFEVELHFGNGLKLNLMIDDAITRCEIADCNKKQDNTQDNSKPDKYDRLAKAKDLFDKGILTKEEYEKEKAKILEEK